MTPFYVGKGTEEGRAETGVSLALSVCVRQRALLTAVVDCVYLRRWHWCRLATIRTSTYTGIHSLTAPILHVLLQLLLWSPPTACRCTKILSTNEMPRQARPVEQIINMNKCLIAPEKCTDVSICWATYPPQRGELCCYEGMMHIPCVHPTKLLPKPYRSHEGTQLYINIIQVHILSQHPRILAPQSVSADYS